MIYGIPFVYKESMVSRDNDTLSLQCTECGNDTKLIVRKYYGILANRYFGEHRKYFHKGQHIRILDESFAIPDPFPPSQIRRRDGGKASAKVGS